MNDITPALPTNSGRMPCWLRPRHGGNLEDMAKAFGIHRDKWLDLSTGIAPYSYPIPLIPERCWQRLPELSPSITQATHAYYGVAMHAVAGSQACIQKIPEIWRSDNHRSTTVYVPKQGYKEHAFAWSASGFCLRYYDNAASIVKEKPVANSVVVLINPNNPTGECLARADVVALHKHMADVGGLLVVDEAFMDVVEPNQSMLNSIASDVNSGRCFPESLIVLRSLGKFFGLAGLRIGFVASSERWRETLAHALGPWSVNGPALYIAEQALQDRVWQRQQRERLANDSGRLQAILQQYFPAAAITGTALFRTVTCDNAQAVHQALGRQAIYVRLLDDAIGLRIGCVHPRDFERLETGLKKACLD